MVDIFSSSDQEVAWLAGLLEGEGSFQVIKNHVGGKIYNYPVVVVTMTDSDVVQRVSDMFGLSMYSLKPSGTGAKKLQYRAQVSGGKAAFWMRKVLPFMGLRRSKKIKECLEYWDARPSANKMRSEAMKMVAAERKRDKNGQFVLLNMLTNS